MRPRQRIATAPASENPEPLRHLRFLALGIFLLLPLACAGTRAKSPAQKPATGAAAKPGGAAPRFLTRVRQLTFEGKRSGEGYFSRDGSKIIFQSEREPGNPFYQIYLMDREQGRVERVSPGFGKTTCGWIHPDSRRVLFASTHLDPDARKKQEEELAKRATGRKRRYAWDYDEWYDLFARRLDHPNEPPRRLTSARGYDAEASWSPNGRQIVFSSNRHAYTEQRSPEGEEKLAADPSYFVDLYIMDASGENVRRLTDTPGYDGGPFFSPDGERIVWRRFSPQGTTAEIMSMKTDGSDVRELTQLATVSWAPFYHPSGEYVIFATALHGFKNFELYMVDAEGEHGPVRVTSSQGFDGLPAFSPDGHELLWTRSTGDEETKSTQLFLADWNDALAREALGLPPIRSEEVAPLLPLPKETEAEISEADLRAHVSALASDVTDGRLTGTAGERIATGYVARAFRSIGLEPAGDGDTYYQEFGFTAGISLGPENHLQLETGAGSKTRDFAVDVDWRPFAFSALGEIGASEIVYAGYGVVAPAEGDLPSLDAYEGLDAKGRWVLVFRYVPEGLSPKTRQHLHRYSSLRYKAMVARDHGARGLLVVSGPNSKVREELAPLRFDVSLAGTSIAAVSITDTLSDALLEPSGRHLQALQDRADAQKGDAGFTLHGVRLSARIDLEQRKSRGRNVIGRLRVGAEPSAQAVVVGAHVDHLGHGEGSSSLARPEEKGQIHYGADDNASGVAALIEIAQQLADERVRGQLDAHRDILFAAWSGEELGLLGSNHWVGELAGPHAEKGELAKHVSAYLNMDMVGRMEKTVSLFGVSSSSIWLGEIERENAPVGLPIHPQQDSYLPTDATSFYLKGVPILSAFTGNHADYHTPRDRPEKLDYAGLRDIARFMERIARSLAAREEAPDYVATTMPARSQGESRMRVYLGTIPDYSQSDTKGVLLSGVARGGPAEKAGLRGGDRVVEVAGRAVENIYDYTYALDALAVDEKASIVIVRDGARVQLEVVPTSRE